MAFVPTTSREDNRPSCLAWPQGHGILNNTMSDPGIPDQRFRLADRSAVTNPAWWSESLPIWVTAERRGQLRSRYTYLGRQTDWLDKIA